MTKNRTEEWYAEHQRRKVVRKMVDGVPFAEQVMVPMAKDARPGMRTGKQSLQVAVSTLQLPYPPTVNHYYGQKKGGGKYILPAGRLYRTLVWGEVKEQRLRKALGRLSVRIVAHPPDRRRRDLDNLLKCTLDALQHAGAYADDEQIDMLTIERREVVKGGRLWVSIQQATGQPVP